MIPCDAQTLLAFAQKLSKNSTPWHHHFLTPACQFATTKKYQLILENEETHEAWVTEFTVRPEKELLELENLFFKRTTRHRK